MLGGSTQEPTSTKSIVGGGEMNGETMQGVPHGSKLRTTIEKRVENIWLESEELGWSYNDFVTHLLEVLIVLNYRGTKLSAKSAGTK
jgi:hypothetical protein